MKRYYAEISIYTTDPDSSYSIKHEGRTKHHVIEILNEFTDAVSKADPNGIFSYTFEETAGNYQRTVILHMPKIVSITSTITTEIVNKSTKSTQKFKLGFRVDDSDIDLEDSTVTENAPVVVGGRKDNREPLTAAASSDA